MTSPTPRPQLEQLAAYADQQHQELQRAQRAALDARHRYITAAWNGHRAGTLTWWDLLDCYDQVRDWGIPGHLTRWREVIPYDRVQLQRQAAAAPRSADGLWRGDTGWPLPKDAIYPPNGRHVAYALLDADGTPVLVSITKHFRERLKRTWNDGRADALDAKRQLVRTYGQPAGGETR